MIHHQPGLVLSLLTHQPGLGSQPTATSPAVSHGGPAVPHLQQDLLHSFHQVAADRAAEATVVQEDHLADPRRTWHDGARGPMGIRFRGGVRWSDGQVDIDG